MKFTFSRDIALIANIGGTPLVMVINPSLPARTVPEFITYAKARPGKLLMASSGIGSLLHVSGALFDMMTGVDWYTYRTRRVCFPTCSAGRCRWH